MINMNQNHPFYEKYRRAQAGLPPVKQETKPLPKPKEDPRQIDTGLGPSWAKEYTPPTRKPVERKSRSDHSSGTQLHARNKKYATRADQIRAEWKPTPRYPTYDDYLADKRRSEALGMDSDQRAQWGSSTHAWE